MENLITFLSTASPTILFIAAILGLVYIIIKLIRGEGLLSNIFSTQQTKYPQLQDSIHQLMDSNEKLMTNHFQHEIPEMKADIKEIKDAVNEIKDNFGNRLTRVETLVQ